MTDWEFAVGVPVKTAVGFSLFQGSHYFGHVALAFGGVSVATSQPSLCGRETELKIGKFEGSGQSCIIHVKYFLFIYIYLLLNMLHELSIAKQFSVKN